MSDQPPSVRRQIADRLATFIRINRLTRSFGGDVYQITPRYYAVDFAVPELLMDGTVQVYSPRFILVLTRGPLARRSNQVYASERAAKDFLRLLLIENKPDEAMAVPIKASKDE